MGELIWDKKTIKKLSSKQMEEINTRRLIVFTRKQLDCIFESIEDITADEFKDDDLFFEHMVIRVITSIFDRVNYDLELLETEINYDTKNIDVNLVFGNGLEVSFTKK